MHITIDNLRNSNQSHKMVCLSNPTFLSRTITEYCSYYYRIRLLFYFYFNINTNVVFNHENEKFYKYRQLDGLFFKSTE